ncbi:MAG: pentapeptide repeat-containing protein [Bacteroidota bacterium]
MNRPLIISLIVFTLLLSGLLLGGWWKLSKVESALLSLQAQMRADSLLALRQDEQLAPLLASLLDRTARELEEHPTRKLREQSIRDIINFSHSLGLQAPAQDRLNPLPLNPLKGQLLLALCGMSMDSSSLSLIWEKANFVGADLRGVDLRGADLRGLDLRAADLSEANLEAARLDQADLQLAVMRETNLAQSQLTFADLQRADLRWVDFRGANLLGARLDGANLVLANAQGAKLRDSSIEYAKVNGAFFEEADLRCTSLKGSDVRQTHFYASNLAGAYIARTDFREADLRQANIRGCTLIGYLPMQLEGTMVDADWLVELPAWETIGYEEVQNSYQILCNGQVRRECWLSAAPD